MFRKATKETWYKKIKMAAKNQDEGRPNYIQKRKKEMKRVFRPYYIYFEISLCIYFFYFFENKLLFWKQTMIYLLSSILFWILFWFIYYYLIYECWVFMCIHWCSVMKWCLVCLVVDNCKKGAWKITKSP